MRELLSTVNWQEEIGSLEATEAWNLFSTTIDSAIEDCIQLTFVHLPGRIFTWQEALHLKIFLKTGCGVSTFKLIIRMTIQSLLEQGTIWDH